MSTYEISKSSLLSLKAEILRKQDEVGKVKLQNKAKLSQQAKKSTPLDLKNKGVHQRELNDTVEDDDLLKNSRAALEAKSKLYDQLSKCKSLDDVTNARYLVRFDKKRCQNETAPPEESPNEIDVDMYPDSDEERHYSDEYEPATDQGDEWMDYVDCLGRTRKCLRKDLEYIKQKDSDLKFTINARRKSEEEKIDDRKEVEQEKQPEPEYNEGNELLSGDMRRELLRQQWEKEEEELRHKSDIHYQDILFNEARTHGVGYYGFSKEEDERARQQEALKKLREETKLQQNKAEELKAMREKQLATRMKAARNRKRARMGLPPEEDVPEEPASIEKEDEKEQDKSEEELKQEKERELLRQKHIRPWDYGKEGVKEHVEYTQEDWVKKQRKERKREFAPPSSYRTSYSRRYSEDDDDTASIDKSLYFTTKKTSKRKESDHDIDTSKPPPKINNPSKNRASHHGDVKYKNYQRESDKFEPTLIVNECTDLDEQQDHLMQDYLRGNADASESGSNDEKRGRGVEIAPPPTFDYYGPSAAKNVGHKVEAPLLEDSISAGLQFLREQVEKKKKSTNHPEEMFIM